MEGPGVGGQVKFGYPAAALNRSHRDGLSVSVGARSGCIDAQGPLIESTLTHVKCDHFGLLY